MKFTTQQLHNHLKFICGAMVKIYDHRKPYESSPLDIFSAAVWHEREVQICLQPSDLVLFCS